jgi:hypothetical protein
MMHECHALPLPAERADFQLERAGATRLLISAPMQSPAPITAQVAFRFGIVVSFRHCERSEAIHISARG